MDAPDGTDIVDDFERHDHHDCRAVGIGDDAARTVKRIFGVALRHDERHVFIHTESARIVNHDRAILGDVGGKLFRGSRPGRGERHVHALEGVVVLEQLNGVFLALEHVLLARTTGRTEQEEVIDREVALGQHAKELLAYGAAGADDCYVHFLFGLNDYRQCE